MLILPAPRNATLGSAKTWQEALDFVGCLNNRNYLGYHDWRLPNINDLSTLIGHSLGSYNAIHLPENHPFLNVPAKPTYWSSTSKRDSNSQTFDHAYITNFIGGISDSKKNVSYNVWPVLGGKIGGCFCFRRFIF